MVRLILPALYEKAAILPARLDERIRRIAAALNGGLAGDSLAPGYKAPLTAFRDGVTVVGIQAVASRASNASAPQVLETPPLPYATEYLGMDLRVKAKLASHLSLAVGWANLAIPSSGWSKEAVAPYEWTLRDRRRLAVPGGEQLRFRLVHAPAADQNPACAVFWVAIPHAA